MNAALQNLYQLQALEVAGPSAGNPQPARLRAGIPQGMLANYDRARARGKKGIAVVRNHVCTNCRMQVPIAVTASLMSGAVQACGNCGLYLCQPPCPLHANSNAAGRKLSPNLPTPVVMNEIKVRKGEPVDRALRRLRKKLDREHTLKDFRMRRRFEKPSARKRRKQKAARFAAMLKARHADD